MDKKQINCLTINTDASYHQVHKVGTYAFYIVCDLFKIQKGGIFKMKVDSPEKSEMMAIGNAIHMVLAQKELPKIKTIVINTDCLNGGNKISSGHRGLGKKIQNMIMLLVRLADAENWEIRHVKAHNGKPDARSFVNDWCDKEAKRWMGIKLKELKKKKDGE